MTTLTVPRERLLSDLLVGDKITAIDGRQLDRPHEVANPRVRTGMPRQYVVGLVNPLGTDTDWCLYEDQVEREVTVERDEADYDLLESRGAAPSGPAIMPAPEPPVVEPERRMRVGESVTVDLDAMQERIAKRAAEERAKPPRVLARRTKHGLTMHTEERGGYRSAWLTEDGDYEISRAWAVTYCDGPHPMRWRDDKGAMRHGYCSGDEEHDYVAGWHITSARVLSGFPDDLYATADEAWRELAKHLGTVDE